ncbi:hypothetical protein [Pseudoduganella violacea]|uniref:Uncharacterized protein n=1 Tax=Pseudoduganella violacea TaxID=1715466 RepID=A0A7W5BFA5_9BURK|nr:hypothetical protein [Pseudoduganella violacea]MBB3122068.1 hypothetical protein [Pseudoduganella violacea]
MHKKLTIWLCAIILFSMSMPTFAQKGIQRHVFWQSGLNVKICQEKTPSRACEETEMPAELGSIKQVIVGKFTRMSNTTWIAVSSKGFALCLFGNNSLTTACRRIAVPKNVSEYEIESIDGMLFFGHKKKSGAEAIEAELSFGKQFILALNAAAQVLEEDARKNDVSSVGRANLTARMSSTHINCSKSDWLQGNCDAQTPDLPYPYPDPEREPDNPGPIDVVIVPGKVPSPDPIPLPELPPIPNVAWASQSGFYVHQRATYLMIGKYLSQADIDTLARAHVAADSPQYQTPASTHRHAMRREGQSTAEAKIEATVFVRAQFERAWNAPSRTDALYEFGLALHAIQDSTSPSHSGFQLWTGRETKSELADHVSKELMNPGQGSALFRATQEAWRWFNDGKLPSGDLFSFGCDGCTPGNATGTL